MPYEVGGGEGTFTTTSESQPPYDELYGDGMVTLTPYGWDPGDPPPPEVYVTDLPVLEPGVGYPWEYHAHEFLGIVDGGWEGEGERVFRTEPVTDRTFCWDLSGISLRYPSVITTTPAARFRFRVSTVLERDLEYQGISRRRHRYTRSLYLDYDYYLTPAQAAAGWEDDMAPTLVESAEFGGRVGDDQWLIRFEGGGMATLVNRGSFGPQETETFTIEADTWYLLELDGTGSEARVTLYRAAGDEPGDQVASTTRSRAAPGEPWELVIWSESELWADALEVSYDCIRVAGQGGFGRIVPGPTWTGGNVFVDDSTDPPSWTAVGGDLVVTSDEPGRALRVHAAGPPELQSSLDDWVITVPFTLQTAGSLTDPGERVLTLSVVIDGRRLDVSARLGDATFAQGLEIAGTVFAARDIPDGYDAWLRLGFDGIAAYAKLWTYADTEPDWDVSLPFEDWPADPEDGEDVIAVAISLGNDGGPAQILTLRPLVIGGGALPGDAVAWQVVGTGDGATDTFATRYPFVPGSLAVRVDRQDVAPSGLAARDGPGRSFTLARAPYGDPWDEAGSAVIEARYTRA